MSEKFIDLDKLSHTGFFIGLDGEEYLVYGRLGILDRIYGDNGVEEFRDTEYYLKEFDVVNVEESFNELDARYLEECCLQYLIKRYVSNEVY